MNTKLSSPLRGKIKITQTTHGHDKNNTQNVLFQRAVDMNSYSDDVLAEGDGVMQITSNTGDYRSYLQPLYDGTPMPKQLVHAIPVKKFIKNEKIKRGQLIGKLAPSIYDQKTKRYVFLKHLHNTFYDATGKGKAPNIFDYMDRSTQVYAEHPEILATNWFKKGIFQWSIWKDLSLNISVPKGNYEVIKEVSLKQKPDIKVVDFKKVPIGSVGTVTSYAQANGGYMWQYIVFKDSAGWIMNEVLKPTTKQPTNILPIEIKPTPKPDPIPEKPPIIDIPAKPNSNDKDWIDRLLSLLEQFLRYIFGSK